MFSSPFATQTPSHNKVRVKRSYQKMLQQGGFQFPVQEYHSKKYKLSSAKTEQDLEMISKKGVGVLNAVVKRPPKIIPERIKNEIEKYNSQMKSLGSGTTYCECPDTYDFTLSGYL